jgi:hypothetical protein
MSTNHIFFVLGEVKGKLSTPVRFRNDNCWVTWETGNNPKMVLSNCRKTVKLQFNFTTAKRIYNCNFIFQLQKLYVGIIKISTAAISVHNCKKMYNCKEMHNYQNIYN